MRTFELGLITLVREARSLAERRIPPGTYEIFKRTPIGDYQLFKPEGGRFIAIVTAKELSRTAEKENSSEQVQ